MTHEGEGDKLIENILSYIENAMSMEDYKGGDEQGKNYTPCMHAWLP